jgi:hypothetical protein
LIKKDIQTLKWKSFGTTNKPKLSTLFFETIYRKFTAELFFAILVKNKDSEYRLYYRDEKISDVKFE